MSGKLRLALQDSDMTTTDDLATQLSVLPIGEFLETLRAAFVRREADIASEHVETHYALAVVSSFPPIGSEPAGWIIEVVAKPMDTYCDEGLHQQGSCPLCGQEAIAEVKRALCGICGSVVGLT
jgi:hypothetical protein